MKREPIILSIETAVRGGSLSLLRGGASLDGWIGEREISKSEDVLEEIKKILERNNLEKKEIDRIFVSLGPGSHTGIRIGIALARGLREALDCELRGVSVLEAMLLPSRRKSGGFGGEAVAAVPFGKSQICWQNLKIGEHEFSNFQNSPQFSAVEDFPVFFSRNRLRSKKNIILHSELYSLFRREFGGQFTDGSTFINAGENLAAVIGATAAESSEEFGLQPIYVRNEVFPR